MKISEFTIRNYRNICYAHAANIPDFVVVCG